MTVLFFWELLALAVACGGYAALVIAIVNRIHALPLPRKVLHWVRLLHDVVIAGLAALLVWGAGWHGPRLLSGGSWGGLASPWGFACAVGWLCAAVFAGAVVRRWFVRTPAALVSRRAELFDIRRNLGFAPLAPGPKRWMADFPGNEIFQVEIVHQELALPRLPAAWDGLSIVHLTDWHFIGTINRPYFEEVARQAAALAPDLFVFTGDLLDDQRLVEWLPQTLGQLKAPLGCWFILGNHDKHLRPDETRRALEATGWRDVSSRCIVIEHAGHSLALGGDERPWMGSAPDFSTAPADAFRLLLSHTPDNIHWARANGVDLMLCGHNHGGQIVLPVIGPVYSPSRHGCRYASGLFWLPPTLAYISRGLPGNYPLRWSCRPEVTRHVLRRESASGTAQSTSACSTADRPAE